MKNKVLIFGISGQDGSLLANLLLNKGCEVLGTSRGIAGNFTNLEALGIKEKVFIHANNYIDPILLKNLLDTVAPNEIYYLSGQSSVGTSFTDPYETFISHNTVLLNILEYMRLNDSNIKLFNASSSEMFGDLDRSANEDTPFSPKSPYAVAKISAHNLTKTYRDSFNLFACNGIVFNHESCFRSENFVTKKIILSAKKIKEGSLNELFLGDIDIIRDWGWAAEYVEAMYMMLQVKTPEDYIIGTGESNSLRDFLKISFEIYGLDYKNYVKYNPQFSRSSDLKASYADPRKAKNNLGWEAKYKMKDVIERMAMNE